jgi:hypothetical protein
MTTLRKLVGSALGVQIAWALLAAAWNFVGVALVHGGGRPLGPTATIAGGLVLVVGAAALPYLVARWPLVYGLLSAFFGAMAIGAVVNAFRADPALWPSESWRYGGAMLNGVGFLAAAAGVAAVAKWWRRRP